MDIGVRLLGAGDVAGVMTMAMAGAAGVALVAIGVLVLGAHALTMVRPQVKCSVIQWAQQVQQALWVAQVLATR